MDIITFDATIQPSSEKGFILLHIEDKWYNLVREYAKQKGLKAGSKVKITFEQWSDDCSEEAFNLFHAYRDALAKETGGADKAWANQLKQELKAKYGPKKIIELGDSSKALWLKSTKEYTVKEMYRLIQGTKEECETWGADIHHLEPEYHEIGGRIDS